MESLLVRILGPTILSFVRCASGSDGVAVKRTLYVGDSLGVRAACGRVFLRVTLVVDVEAETKLDAVAERGACIYIIVLAGKGLEGQVADLLRACVEILEGFRVSAWRLSGLSSGRQGVLLIIICGDRPVTRYRASTGSLLALLLQETTKDVPIWLLDTSSSLLEGFSLLN